MDTMILLLEMIMNLNQQLFEIINNQIDQGYNALDDFYITNDIDTYYENDKYYFGYIL